MAVRGNCKENVFNYLCNQNRPYSANDVSQNLHKEFGKTAILKALEELTSESKIKEKSYGKQKVYSVIQGEENETEDPALDLMTLDSNIELLSEELKVAEQNLKKAEGALKELERKLSTEKALKEKIDLEALVVRLQESIDSVSTTSLKISDKEKMEISRTYDTYTKEYKKRKKLCMDMINSIMEYYPKKLKNLFEEIGIEADEDKPTQAQTNSLIE